MASATVPPTAPGASALHDVTARLRACERNCRATRVDRVEIEHVDLPAPEAPDYTRRSYAVDPLGDVALAKEATELDVVPAPEPQLAPAWTTNLGTLMDVFG